MYASRDLHRVPLPSGEGQLESAVSPPVAEGDAGDRRKYEVQFRRVLQILFNLNPVQLYRFFHTPMGEALLSQLLNLARVQSDRSPELNLQVTQLQTSKASQGNLVLGLLRRLFAHIQLSTDWIHLAVERFEQLQRATEETVDAVSQLAAVEASTEPPLDFSALPDIRCSGRYGVVRQAFSLTDKSRDRHFRVVLYKPQQWRPGKAPVLVISHGLGSSPEDFKEYAEHLTSHGYVVAIPQHPGSDAIQVKEMLAGLTQEVFKLQEFLDRPLDVSYVLDELERRNPVEYGGHLNLKAVGVMGHSFGAYTALALAGAEITFEKLERACGPIFEPLNLSLLLQCQALKLPRQIYSLRDQRIKAVLPVDPVGSEVFGPEGLRQIRIPVLIIAGSEDKTAPVVLEQIRIFPWLKTVDRYLALMKGKAHFGNFSTLETGLKAMLLRVLPNVMGSGSTLFYNYAYAISLAFFEVYLAKNAAYRPYLQASYAEYLSQAPFNFHLISAASTVALTETLQSFEAKLLQLDPAGASYATL